MAAEKRLEAVFGAQGLQALRWAGADVLKDGAPRVSRIILEKRWLGDDGLSQYDFEEADVADPEVSFDRGNVNITEPGGVVYYHYGLPRVAPGKALTIKMSLRFVAAEAGGDEPIADLIEGFRDYHTPRMAWEDR
jgi:hypothetical protein